MTHHLKTWREYFGYVANGQKTFEIRLNDRDFHTGDMLVLEEYDNGKQEYTGESITCIVTYILNKQPFVPEGYVCMSIQKLSAQDIKLG